MNLRSSSFLFVALVLVQSIVVDEPVNAAPRNDSPDSTSPVVVDSNEVPPAVATMAYERAVRIVAAGLVAGEEPISVERHAATRCFDWDADGDLDLWVGGGDGRLWLYRNDTNAARAPGKVARFQTRQPIQAGGRTKWGDSFTGIVFAHLVGDELPDLIVGHSDHLISIHENVGALGSPVFAEDALTFRVQDGCHGRFDVGDWDGDGLQDCVTGSFGGPLVWYRNQGTKDSPVFGDGEAFHDLAVAYNSHPRIVDFNRDGRLDLLLGVNWGSVTVYLNNGASRNPRLAQGQQLQWVDGSNLGIRELNGDDTTPELADLDGDGVLDLISGGKNGRLFWMKGVDVRARIRAFRETLAQHAGRLGSVLRENDAVRSDLFGTLTSLRMELSNGLFPQTDRQRMFDELASLAEGFPAVLKRARFDLQESPHLPILAAQFWVVLFESLDDSPEHRDRVAAVLGFEGGYRALLNDFGVLLIDNDTATAAHLEAMHRLMSAIPRGTWDVETITVAGWLGPAIRTQSIRSRSGINIFDLPLGRTEDSFASDSPRPGVTDVYLICLAHELAHNMLDTIGRKTRPELFERKFEGLAQAAGPHVVYRSPKSRGIDFEQTKANFRENGFWDGKADSWRDAWDAYFKGKPEFDRAYSRGNVKFFLDSPQEAFATLANQYFADSGLMLEFCKTRWDAGHISNVNQFLLIADYLSEGSDSVRFYRLQPGGKLSIQSAALVRDETGRIVQVQSPELKANFRYQEGALVSEFDLVKRPAADE